MAVGFYAVNPLVADEELRKQIYLYKHLPVHQTKFILICILIRHLEADLSSLFSFISGHTV